MSKCGKGHSILMVSRLIMQSNVIIQQMLLNKFTQQPSWSRVVVMRSLHSGEQVLEESPQMLLMSSMLPQKSPAEFTEQL